jgi:serine aminopeptidase S33 family
MKTDSLSMQVQMNVVLSDDIEIFPLNYNNYHIVGDDNFSYNVTLNTHKDICLVDGSIVKELSNSHGKDDSGYVIKYVAPDPELGFEGIKAEDCGCEGVAGVLGLQAGLEFAVKRLIIPAQLCNHDDHYNWSEIAPWLMTKATKNIVLSEHHCEVRDDFIDRGFDNFIVRTHDGANLNTIEYKHENQKHKPIEDQKYIVYFMGNKGSYSVYIDDVIDTYMEIGFNIVSFDYGGCGRSNGRHPRAQHDLITDGVAQIQRLLDEGVSPDNIVIHGHSLGGAISVKVAKHFYDVAVAKHGPDTTDTINIFVDRTFGSSYNKVLVESELANLPMAQTSWAAYRECIFKNIGWDLDVAIDYKQLPSDSKTYTYVYATKEQREADPDNYPRDYKIPHQASLHFHVDELATNRKACISKCSADGEMIKQGALSHLLEHEKMRVVPDDADIVWHKAPLSKLPTQHGAFTDKKHTAADYLKEFALRATSDSDELLNCFSAEDAREGCDELVLCPEYYKKAIDEEFFITNETHSIEVFNLYDTCPASVPEETELLGEAFFDSETCAV